MRKGKSHYEHVLTNFYCKGCEQISFEDLKRFKPVRCLILFDELTLDADSRSFKSFPKEIKDFFVMHRHCFNDIIYFIQDYSRIDKTIRELTYDLWYVHKPVLPFFRRFSIARKIFRNIAINEFTSELVLGYRFSKFLERLFMPCIRYTYRPRWYEYFDSFDEGVLASRPVFKPEPWDNVLPSDMVL